MIAVLGSELDAAAHALVKAWAAEGAVLLGAKDLCTRGWVFHALRADDGAFVANGSCHPAGALRAVVVRRPAVAAEELPWIAGDDRQYVATEINAFLVAWLTALSCPVFNRPTATSLCGPAWSAVHWQHAAARAGVRWSSSPDTGPVHDAVFCRGLNHGALNRRQAAAGVRLAKLSGADLLGLRFAGDAVAAVTLQPSLAEPGARNIVLTNLPARAGMRVKMAASAGVELGAEVGVGVGTKGGTKGGTKRGTKVGAKVGAAVTARVAA